MRNHITLFSVLVIVLLFSSCKTGKSYTKENDASAEKNFYLGQKPPGLMPEVFAPNLVTTTNWEYGGVFTPDMKEFYFIRKAKGKEKQEFVVLQLKNNEWHESVISPRIGQPFISPDGKTMHLGRRYKERNDNGEWSKIKELDTPFDSLPIMRLTASSMGTYFFDEFKRDFTGDIRYSRLVNGMHEQPRLLNKKDLTQEKAFTHLLLQMSRIFYLIAKEKTDLGILTSILVLSKEMVHGVLPLIWETK